MDNLGWTIFVSICVIGLFGGFVTVFAATFRYLLSVWALARDLRKHDHVLWASLGRPSIFGSATLLDWFREGGKGATSDKVRVRAVETRRRFLLAVRLFVIYMAVFLVIWALLWALAPER